MTKQNQFLSFLSSTDPQTILWREWRTSLDFDFDFDFAAYLFDLLVDTPVGQTRLIPTIGLLTTLLITTSSLVGVALGLLAGNWLAGLLLGSSFGMGLGIAVITLFRRREDFTWRVWLQAMIPSKPLLHAKNPNYIRSVFLIITISLASLVGVGLTGYLFFGQPSSSVYVPLAFLATLPIFGYWARRDIAVNSSIISITVLAWMVGTTVGSVTGLFFGMGFAQLVGLSLGPLSVDASATVVGLATGVVIGLYAGRWLGWMFLTSLLLLVGLLALSPPLNLVLIGYLGGFGLASVVSGLSLFLPKYAPSLVTASSYYWRYSHLLFWWRQRPFATELETALQQHPKATKLLKHLDNKRRHKPSLEVTLHNLHDHDWTERFIAWQLLVDWGSQVIPKLVTLLNDTHIAPTALWLIKSIGHETTVRLGYRAEQMINPDTFTCCGQHVVNGSTNGSVLTQYYGCRLTGRSYELLFCPAGIIAVLDENWPDLFSHTDGQLRVNWLLRPELFDFTEVEIKQADDEQIERLAVQVGNDMDPLRRKRYPLMSCVIYSPISDNTLRVLERTFGEVVR